MSVTMTAIEATEFSQRACPSCAASSYVDTAISSQRRAEMMRFEELRPYWSGFYKEKVFFSYRRCKECGLLFAPVFFDEAQLGDLYRSMDANMALVPKAQLRRTQQGYFNILKSTSELENGYMEIGPDVGLFAENCVRQGRFAKYWLFEPNRSVLRELQTTMGTQDFTVIHDMFDFSAVPDQSVGAAVMIHVLDHLLNPLTTLKEIRKKLAPDGKLLIVTHNEASFLRYIAAGRWPPFCLQHPQLYCPNSMRALLKIAGYKIVDIERTKNYFPIQFLLLQSLWALGFKPKSAPTFWNKSIGLRVGNIATVASVY
jgi:hypothetical protein